MSPAVSDGRGKDGGEVARNFELRVDFCNNFLFVGLTEHLTGEGDLGVDPSSILI